MATDLYVKKDWQTGETITEAALDNLEKGVADANTAVRTLEANAFTSIQVTTLNAGEQASAVTPAASVLPIIVGDLIEDATRAVWQVESVADGTFTVGAAAVRNAPAA